MSIQRRLAISVALVLCLSLSVGVLMTYAHVLAKVHGGVKATLDEGIHRVLNAVDDEEEKVSPARRLQLVVGDFDGDPRLKARLVDSKGKILSKSRSPSPDVMAPAWFERLVAVAPAPTTVSLPAPFQTIGLLVLEVDPRTAIAEAWADARLTVLMMVVVFALMLVFALLSIKIALAPLRDTCAKIARIGSGDTSVRIERDIAHELAPLRDGFNGMAERLDEIDRQNVALKERILNAQEDERAELGRDLHDDVAPFLFGIGADAAMISHYLATGAASEVQSRAEAITAAVKHMQRRIKDVLLRLAPGGLLEFGLIGAIDDLLAFWKARYPHCTFRTRIDGARLEPPLDAVAFRVVQESLSNAMRHGAPSIVDVSIDARSARAKIVVKDNGTGFSAGGPPAGFGLAGMQQRVRSVGGTASVRNRRRGHGVIVEVLLPLRARCAPAAAYEVNALA